MSRARVAAERELPTLPPEIARLPVAHLHLQGRAASLATTHETIGAIFASEAASQSRESGALQIRRVLDALVAAVTHDRCNGWDSFRRTRPPLIERSTIFLYSPRLQRLNKAAAMSPVARLHLSRRAINSLAAVGISNLEQLVGAAAAGIRDVAALGPLTALEISESLDALAYSVRDDGSVDWMSYAERRGFDLLPAKAQESYSGRDFLAFFPQACQHAVLSRFGRAGVLVLAHRLFRHADITVSLETVGQQLGLTRERVRLLESAIIAMLRRAFWRGEYQGCRFRFRSAFLEPIRRLSDSVQNSARVLSRTKWAALLQETWQVSPFDLGQQEELIRRLVGLEPEVAKETGDDAAGDNGEDVAFAIKRIFTSEPRQSFTIEQLFEKLSGSDDKTRVGQSELAAILERLPEVEREKTAARYRLRLEHLKTHVDRCERVLRDAGFPLHYREIAQTIDRLLPKTAERVNPKTLAMRMAGAPRFTALGKSGVWSLREWTHIPAGSVADLATKVMSGIEGPLTESAIFELLRQFRPVRQTSLGTLLRDDRRFRRVAPATWMLVRPADHGTPKETVSERGVGESA